jgi:hypothetical protein
VNSQEARPQIRASTGHSGLEKQIVNSEMRHYRKKESLDIGINTLNFSVARRSIRGAVLQCMGHLAIVASIII